MKTILWFRNDLRIHDNPCLYEAEKSGYPILCFYCLPKQEHNYYSLGFPRFSELRFRFLLESVLDLKKHLQQLGGDLLVVEQEPEVVLHYLGKLLSEPARLFFQAEIASEEKQQEQRVKDVCHTLGWKVSRHFNSVLYDVNKLPFSVAQTPDLFTAFRKKIEKECTTEKPLPDATNLYFFNLSNEISKGLSILSDADLKKRLAELPNPDERTAFPFSGGESQGKKRLHYYLFESKKISTYKETRNGLIGNDYSSKLSPWLANGCLSPRYVVQQLSEYERDVEKNESTYWLFFELLWREYWRYVFIKHGNAFFRKQGISSETNIWKQNSSDFELWKTGTTGFPLVDANMRELAQSGWMSNRGRQIVASFLAKNLEIDWRWGAAWFESRLLDYDVYSNWGNWAYVAGVGNDGRNRYFNLITQGQNYDAKGAYIQLWIPELGGISGESLHTLHRFSHSDRILFRVNETGYPKPMINLDNSYGKLNKRLKK